MDNSNENKRKESGKDSIKLGNINDEFVKHLINLRNNIRVGTLGHQGTGKSSLFNSLFDVKKLLDEHRDNLLEVKRRFEVTQEITKEEYNLIDDFLGNLHLEGRGYSHVLSQFLLFMKLRDNEPKQLNDIKHEFRCGLCEDDFEVEKDALECFKICSYESCKERYGGVLPVEKTLFNGKVVSEEICK